MSRIFRRKKWNKEMPSQHRIAFFGTPELTIPILDSLEAANLLLSVIVTAPDKPKGRGQELTSPAPKAWAEAHNIPILQPEKIGAAFIESFKKLDIELGIVVAYGKILPQALLDAPSRGMLNVHYSLLPKYRGASPVEAAILAGDAETGVSIQKMVFKLDAGDVIAEARTMIGPDETAPALRERLNGIAKELLPQAAKEVLDGTATYRKQDESLATRCGKFSKEDGEISLTDNGAKNYRKFRAHFAWPGTYFFAEKHGRRIRIIVKAATFENGVFIPTRIVPEGRKEVSYDEFLRN